MLNPSVEKHAHTLADYLPNGKLFEAKNIQDSNFRQLIRGLAFELFNAQGYLCTLEQEYLPDLTTLFLDEWESALGIPDHCFSGSGTATERRRDILAKLTALGVQTAADFETLALIFGKVVTVTSLSDEAYPPFAVPFTPISLPEGRYVIVVSGVDLIENVPPYDVPFDLLGVENILQCLFERIAPANCSVIFRNLN